MNATIVEIVDLLCGRGMGPNLMIANKTMTIQAIRGVGSELLRWLRAKVEKNAKRDLKLSSRDLGAARIRQFVDECPGLNELFECTEVGLRFRDAVPESERDEIAQFTTASYKPQVIR